MDDLLSAVANMFTGSVTGQWLLRPDGFVLYRK
jgi:hypothetical protein